MLSKNVCLSSKADTKYRNIDDISTDMNNNVQMIFYSYFLSDRHNLSVITIITHILTQVQRYHLGCN